MLGDERVHYLGGGILSQVYQIHFTLYLKIYNSIKLTFKKKYCFHMRKKSWLLTNL